MQLVAWVCVWVWYKSAVLYLYREYSTETKVVNKCHKCWKIRAHAYALLPSEVQHRIWSISWYKKKRNTKKNANRVKPIENSNTFQTREKVEILSFHKKTVFYSQPHMGIRCITYFSNFDPHFQLFFYSSQYNSTFLFSLRSRMQRRVWTRNHILV